MPAERICVVIPAYRCPAQIVRVISQYNPTTAPWVAELVVLDDASPDNTGEAALKALHKIKALAQTHQTKLTLLRNTENYNLGGGHKSGFAYARAQGHAYVAILHGDDQATLEDLIPQLDMGHHKTYECLLGARFMRQSKLIRYSWFRIFGNIVFHTLFTLASGRMTWDMGSGINLYSAKLIDRNLHGFARDNLTFHCYYLLNIYANRVPYLFFPISWRSEDQVSNAKLVRQSMEILKILLSYAANRKAFLAGQYGTFRTYTTKVIWSSLS